MVPIHVLRDPRGRTQSVRKRKQQHYLPALSYSYRSLRMFALLNSRPHIVVNYERLAADPKGWLNKLMQRLGLELEEQQLSWAELSHHNIGAIDVLQKTNGSTIRVDQAWKEHLPRHTQKLVKLLAYPGLKADQVKESRWGL